MNAKRVPFEALEERSRVCFGGFRRSHEDAPCGSTESFTSTKLSVTHIANDFALSGLKAYSWKRIDGN